VGFICLPLLLLGLRELPMLVSRRPLDMINHDDFQRPLPAIHTNTRKLIIAGT
jgi:hypothetical protein